MKIKSGLLAIASLISIGVMSFEVQAGIATPVQYSSAGNGIYDVTGITSFDFRDDSTAVIRQTNVVSSNGQTTLFGFFATAIVGDTVSFDLHYQSILTGMTNGAPQPDLDIDGAGAGDISGFEVTTVLSARETATVLAAAGGVVTLQFTNVVGSYKVYHDDTPDADELAGTGFDNGVEIVSGTLGFANGGAGSLFTAGATFGSGSTFFQNTIDSYNTDYIEADPFSAGSGLVGTSSDTTLNLSFGSASPIDDGGLIGVDQYIVQGGDLKLAADATIDFQRVPEPSALFLLGGGLFMMGGMIKRQRKA